MQDGAVMCDIAWTEVVHAMLGGVPDTLKNALVELGVALYRVEVVNLAMQARVRVEMSAPDAADRPVTVMTTWPEYLQQERAFADLGVARRVVEVQARAWVVDIVGEPRRVHDVDRGDEGNESPDDGRAAELPPPPSLLVELPVTLLEFEQGVS